MNFVAADGIEQILFIFTGERRLEKTNTTNITSHEKLKEMSREMYQNSNSANWQQIVWNI